MANIELTRACAVGERSLVVSSVSRDSDIYEPQGTLWRFSDEDGEARWGSREVEAHVERIVPNAGQGDVALLSSEGEVILDVFSNPVTERIMGAGTWIDGAKGYGRMLALAWVGGRLHASGNGGQIYVRSAPGTWTMLTDALLFDPDAHRRLSQTAPATTDPGFLQWLRESRAARPQNLALHDIAGLGQDAVYVCGVDATKPFLAFWNGSTVEELKTFLDEGALTGIHVERPDSVWVCGREGVLLHGSAARGFAPVTLRAQRNLFHMVVPYRERLVLPSSVRPGGLFTVDPKTPELRRFTPPLPKLCGEHIFFAGAAGDVLWVVGPLDIFRFDGSVWERIDHPEI